MLIVEFFHMSFRMTDYVDGRKRNENFRSWLKIVEKKNQMEV